ncbi:MAG: hypothetical protein IJE62_00030, partial [Clostridia bacterium]|nr:hypothetical protein [Clostridia bacterium]
GYSTYRLTKPTLIAVDVIDVSAADCWSMAITSDGKLYGAGRNTNGQLGTGDYDVATSLGGYLDRNEAHPVIPNLQGEIPVKVSTGDNYTMVVTQDGGLWGFGKSFYGQLGENTQTGIGLAGTNVPVKIMDCVKDVFCGDTCSIILTVDDNLVQLGGPDKGFINNTDAGNVQLKTGISQINNTGLPMTLDTNGSLYLIKNKVFTPIEIKIPYEATTEIRYVFQGGSVITVYVGGDKEINGGIFLIAFYKNDVLQDVLKQPVNKLGDAITFNPPPDSDKCRIFLFKDFETIKPLAEDKGFELASSTNIIATATEEKVSGYKTTYNVTVEMGLESQNFANTPVTLTVVPDNAKDESDLLDAAYIYQGFLDDDASATITFPIHCDYAGLKVCANAGGIYLGEAHIIEQ